MKTYAIIVDENNEKRVVPSSWLSEDLKKLKWPADPLIDIKKAIIHCEETEPDWETYTIKKFIKYNDNYTDAVKQMAIPELENISDPSDVEKLRRSRKERCKKIMDDQFISGISKKKQKISDKSSSEDDETENTNTVTGNKLKKSFKAPPTLKITSVAAPKMKIRVIDERVEKDIKAKDNAESNKQANESDGELNDMLNMNMQRNNTDDFESVIDTEEEVETNNSETEDSQERASNISKEVNNSSKELNKCPKEANKSCKESNNSSIEAPEKLSSHSDETDSTMLQKILENKKKMFKQLIELTLKVNMQNKQIEQINKQASAYQSSSLTSNDMKIIHEYFPINNEGNKKILTVEEKLESKQFVKVVVINLQSMYKKDFSNENYRRRHR